MTKIYNNYLNNDDHENDENYTRLANILEKELGHPVTLKEAKEIGKDLVELYKALAGKRRIVKVGLRFEGKKDSNRLNR